MVTNLTKLLPRHLHSMLESKHFVCTINMSELSAKSPTYTIVEGTVRIPKSRTPKMPRRTKSKSKPTTVDPWANVIVIVNRDVVDKKHSSRHANQPDGPPAPLVMVCRMRTNREGVLDPAILQHAIKPHHVRCQHNDENWPYLLDRYSDGSTCPPSSRPISVAALRHRATDRTLALMQRWHDGDPTICNKPRPICVRPAAKTLKYVATARIKSMAEPREPRAIPYKKLPPASRRMPKHLLNYKATERLLQIARVPSSRNRINKACWLANCPRPLNRKALEYRASARIVSMAKAREVFGEPAAPRELGVVDKRALTYRASRRTCQMAKPRTLFGSDESDRKQKPMPPVAWSALRYVATRRTKEMARPRCVFTEKIDCSQTTPYWRRIDDPDTSRWLMFRKAEKTESKPNRAGVRFARSRRAMPMAAPKSSCMCHKFEPPKPVFVSPNRVRPMPLHAVPIEPNKVAQMKPEAGKTK